MSHKPYKPLGMDLVNNTRRDHERTIRSVLTFKHKMQILADQGRDVGADIRARVKERTVARALQTQIAALDEALARNKAAISELGRAAEDFLRSMRDQTAEIAKRGVEAVRERQRREEKPRPSFGFSPY